jgi:glycine/D-amino acid oxidase-like deaminating enzyme
VTVCLHEKRGGFAYSRDSVQGLARKTREAGVQIAAPVAVTGFEFDGSGAVTRVDTSHGPVRADQVVVAV